MLAVTQCWTAPGSPAAFAQYLGGRWTLGKTLQYERGGISGTFAGSAIFLEITNQVLAYEEDGVATLGSDQFAARAALLYDCSNDNAVRVFFDEAKNRESAAAVLAGGRFFHTISWPLGIFEHPCGPDMYYGRLLLQGPDAFVLDWKVRGPRKYGHVVSRFGRKRGAGAA